ncbi:adhesion G-protein coupled receptor G4 [Psammomys obesus]|uniref:adhesion G-protein coupled receptor G4 n=1 Tax=Psammomys obesus TaxID=48139 RepID=UPI0024535878|nr:adhesion G-protein coupled receptor G4 [Psammomys obesus]
MVTYDTGAYLISIFTSTIRLIVKILYDSLKKAQETLWKKRWKDDSLSLKVKEKRLDFYGEGKTYVSQTNTIPELSRLTVWDHLLEDEEFMTCLYGNVVSWEDDVWLIHKISPTTDKRLRCFVSENMKIQEMSTTVSQQFDLTAPSQITGLNPQKSVHSSTVFPESKPAFTVNHAAISYSHTLPSPLATVNASKELSTSTAQTAPFSAGILYVSTTIPLPIQHITEHPYLGKTKTTKMVEAMTTEAFHPTVATYLFDTPVITKNYIVSETLATKSQSGKTTLFSMNESTIMSTTSCPKHKSTDVAIPLTSKSGQEFLISSAARTLSWSTLEETSALATDVGIASAFPPESLLTSTAAPSNSVFTGNRVASTLPGTEVEIPFMAHSGLPMETIPSLRTLKTESVPTNFQDVFSPGVVHAMSSPMPKETSSTVFSSIISSPVTGIQDEQIVIDTKSTYPASPPRTKLVPTLAEVSLCSTMEGLAYTQNAPTTDEPMLTLIFTKSPSTYNTSESGLTPVTNKTDCQFFTNETTLISKSGQTPLTSMNTTTIPTFIPNKNLTLLFQGNTTDIDHSSMTANITPLEAPTENKATASSDATTAKYTIAVSKPTSQGLSNFSSLSEITFIPSQLESKLSTLVLKSSSTPTVAANELPSTPRETVVPSVDVSTLPDITPHFSTEKSISETTQIETNYVSTFDDTMAPLPMSATTQKVFTTVTNKPTSCHPKVKSTIAAVAKASPFSAVLETTDKSAQMVTASVTVSPFPDTEELTNALNNETATAEMGVSWLSTKMMKSTPRSSYNGTTETSNRSHTYVVYWTSETAEGNGASPPTSMSTQAFPELLTSSITRMMGTTFSTAPSQKTAVSLSLGILPQQTAAPHSSATPQRITNMLSLPVNSFALTSPATTMVGFDESKVTLSQPSTLARDFTTSMLSVGLTVPTVTKTIELVLPMSPKTSTSNDIMSTHIDPLHATSEVTEISSTAAFMAVSSLRETMVTSLRPPTPVITKAITTLPSISADLVSPSIYTLVCSRPPANNITIVSSTCISSTASTSVATTPASHVEASTHGFSFPYAFSSAVDVSMASGPTETSAAGESMSPHTAANRFTTLVDSESTTNFINTPVSTQLVVATSVLSLDKEQTNISMRKTPRTTRVAEISPSKNSFISNSQSTFPWKMTGTEFSEITEVSSHRTHLPSEILPGYPSSGNVGTSSTSGSRQTTQTLTSSAKICVNASEGSTTLEKTALPSHVPTITKSLSPDKERTRAPSEYPPKTVEKIVSSFPVTHPATGHQATLFADASRTTRISHPVLINTTLSHLLSLKTQPAATWIASSTSGSTQTFLKSFSPFTTGLLNTNFTMITPDGSTTVFSVPNELTNFPEETSMEMSTSIDQMASLPLSVTAFTSKRVSNTPTMLMTKSSRTTHSGDLKCVSIGTSGLTSEKSSMPANNSDFLTTVLSSDTSIRLGTFFTSLSSSPPKTTKTTQASTLDITPVYSGPTSQSTVGSSTFTISEMAEVPFNNTTTPVSSPVELDFSSMKTIPTISVARTVTSVIDITPSSQLSSKNTEDITSIPKTMFSSLLSTTQQSPQKNEATTLDILPGITNSFLSTENSGGVTELINAHSRITVPASGLSSTPSDSFYTSLNIQVFPSLTNFRGTLRPTESVKPTVTHSSLDTGKTTSLSESMFSSEITKSSTCLNTPVLYPSWTQASKITSSLTSFFYSPDSTEAKFPLTSQKDEFPAWGIRITTSTAKSPLTTSRNTPRVEDSQFPFFTTTAMTPIRMEADPLHFTPWTLSTSPTSQIGLVSRDITTMPSIFTSESLPTFGISGSTSLSTSSTVLPTTLAAIKYTFEKTSMLVTPETTLSPNSSVISKATLQTWSLSSLPSDSLTSVSNPPQFLTSPAGEVSESTFPSSDMIATCPNFTIVLRSDRSATPTQAIPVATLGVITLDSLTSLPISTKPKDDSLYTSTFLESSSRTPVAKNFTTVPESMSFSRMSTLSSITSHDLSNPMETSVWSKVQSQSHTLIPPESTLDTVLHITTTTGASFPLMSTEMTHPSTATESSLISSSFETTWMNSTFSFLFTQASTSPITTVSTVFFYNIKMSFSVFDEEPRVLITTVIHEFAKDWLNFMFQNSEFSLANLRIEIKSRQTSKEDMDMYRRIIFLGGIPLRRALASIYLPKSLREKVPLNGLKTILFNFFGQTSLFKAQNNNTSLMTYVVSASISNMSIQNLAGPVLIILKHIQGNWNYGQVYCAFWDFDTNNGLGGWNPSGCKVKETNVNYTICQCNHLTHFGVLMDLSRSTVDAANERILMIITYTGCGISSIFLGIAMVTYIAFHKLRKDYPSKILINLCTALLMLNLAFLVNSWLTSFQKVGLCITAAVALHYFLLVSLTWMGLEAVHMYFALVKVFNTYIPNYILKFCVAGWGIPALTVVIILSVRKDLYGTLSPTTPFCWIKDDHIFYIWVVAYFCLIFLTNLSMFCTVLIQLASVKSQSQKTRKKMILNDLKGTISLTFLLGLTWGFAFFAWGPVRIFFMYLFAICNTLQGFLIFVFYCVMKESVREQWHMHLHCRWLRLENVSDGRSRFGINVRHKQKRLKEAHEPKLLTLSLKSTTTNSTFKSIGSLPSTPSEINFPNGHFDGGPYTFSSLSCEAVPAFIRRALPANIKTNSIHKQRSFSINVSRDAHLTPSPGLGEMFNL